MEKTTNRYLRDPFMYFFRTIRSNGRRTVPLFVIHCSLFVIFSSCMREDLRLCEPSTFLSLSFVYDKENEEQIEDICVLLFDRDSLLYRSHLLEAAAFDNSEEAAVPVDAGDYFVVAFGNSTDDLLLTRAGTGTHLEALYLPLSDETALFYAPSKEETRSREYENYRVEVIEGKENRHILSFLPAFHRIQVYLKGIEKEAEMTVSLLEVSAGYDLHLVPLTEQVSCTKYPVEILKEQEEFLLASFYVPHFDADTPMTIRVENPEDGRVDNVSLQEILTNENIIPTDGSCLSIEIIFIYKENVLVEVTLPSWHTQPTEPGFH